MKICDEQNDILIRQKVRSDPQGNERDSRDIKKKPQYSRVRGQSNRNLPRHSESEPVLLSPFTMEDVLTVQIVPSFNKRFAFARPATVRDAVTTFPHSSEEVLP